MKTHVSSDLPTIYADMNIYRYVAYGDISIEKPERFRWVYSHVHLDEIVRSKNKDALAGMRILNAVEILDVLNENFQSTGSIRLREYLDPVVRYERHLEAISGLEEQSDLMVEHLLRFFGADNFDELSLTPDKLRNEIDRLTNGLEDERREELLGRAEAAAVEMKETINTHLREQHPIDQTRLKMGLASSVRKDAEKSSSPIDELWKILQPHASGIEKNQFFGFEPIPGIDVQHTQHGSFAGAHMVLNLLGLSPDRSLAKRDKIKQVVSDGQHVGMASYCNGMLSADKRFCDKANAIFKHTGSYTNALWFPYKKGFVVQLGVTSSAT